MNETIEEEITSFQTIKVRQALLVKPKPEMGTNPLLITLRACKDIAAEAVIYLLNHCLRTEDISFKDSSKHNRADYAHILLSTRSAFCFHCGCSKHAIADCPAKLLFSKQRATLVCFAWAGNRKCYKADCRYAHIGPQGIPLKGQEFLDLNNARGRPARISQYTVRPPQNPLPAIVPPSASPRTISPPVPSSAAAATIDNSSLTKTRTTRASWRQPHHHTSPLSPMQPQPRP